MDPNCLWPGIVFNPFRMAKFVVCPNKPLLNLGVPWLKNVVDNRLLIHNFRSCSELEQATWPNL
jgi:hypothetical protein